MMNNLTEICKYSRKNTPHVSMEATIREKMAEFLNQTYTPKNYYFLKDLTNPIQKYWSAVRPDVKIPPELARAFSQGTQLQVFSTPWFRNIPGFSIDEGLLDGAFVGIPGVRGKVDFLIGDSIIEFKTKSSQLPVTAEDILTKYPQDVEQLVFYSVLHPSFPQTNYLVFMGADHPHPIKVFKVFTKEPKKVRNIIIKRMNALDSAIETKDWKKLGRCRYFDGACHFKSSESCSCGELDALDMSEFASAVEITPDQDFSDKIEEGKKKYAEQRSVLLTSFDILAPRKRYSRRIMEFEDPYEKPPEQYKYESCLWRTVNSLKFSLNEVERQEVLDSLVDKRVKIPFRWLKIPSSSRDGGEILPYVLKVPKSVHPFTTTRPSNYSIAEMGIVCALHGRQKGLIINMYPKMDKFVRVFEASFENVKGLQKFVRSQIGAFEEAERTENFEKLPPCPGFLNDNKSCPMDSECHAGNRKGCRSK